MWLRRWRGNEGSRTDRFKDIERPVDARNREIYRQLPLEPAPTPRLSFDLSSRRATIARLPNRPKPSSSQAGFETISARRISDDSMKHPYFPGITDIVVVTDPENPRHPEVSRRRTNKA